MIKCFCKKKNGEVGENEIMCGAADGGCAVRDYKSAGNCAPDQICSGPTSPSNAVVESNKDKLCSKGILLSDLSIWMQYTIF